MNQYSKSSIDSFVEEVNNITETRERWLTHIKLYGEHYDYTMSILYIDKIFTAFKDTVLIIITNDSRDLKLRIGEDTILEISKVNSI